MESSGRFVKMTYNLINNDNNNNINNNNYTSLSLTTEEYDEIILTRLISSGISILACFICIIIYISMCIIKGVESRKENKMKKEMHLNQMEDPDNLHDFQEEIFENNNKKEMLISAHEYIDNPYIIEVKEKMVINYYYY